MRSDEELWADFIERFPDPAEREVVAALLARRVSDTLDTADKRVVPVTPDSPASHRES